MILEVAILNVVAGRESEFEAAFADAQRYLRSIDGYLSHELRHCIACPTATSCWCNGANWKIIPRAFATHPNTSIGAKPYILFTTRSQR